MREGKKRGEGRERGKKEGRKEGQTDNAYLQSESYNSSKKEELELIQ